VKIAAFALCILTVKFTNHEKQLLTMAFGSLITIEIIGIMPYVEAEQRG
jgi:hypothetical protein